MAQPHDRILFLALENQQWNLAAHVLILAALRIHNNESHNNKIRQRRKLHGKQGHSSAKE